MNERNEHPKRDGITGGAPTKREYTAPAIVYESTLTTRAGSCLDADRGCHVDPSQLFGQVD